MEEKHLTKLNIQHDKNWKLELKGNFADDIAV